jgi:hypothetical protein
VSKWGDDFAGQGARMLAGYFGTGSASARYLDLDQTSRLLSHLVIGEEYKKYETSEYSEHLVFKRDAWAIVDPSNPEFCGIANLKNGAKVILNEVEYTIDEAHRNEHIVDFRMVRRAPSEFRGEQDYRGRG